MSDVATARQFVPEDVNPGDWSQLEPLYQALREREIDSLDSLYRWLGDFSELSAVVSEEGARRRIAQACHTDDAEIEQAFLHFIEQIVPKLRPIQFELQKKLLDTPVAGELDSPRFQVLLREWRAEVELFRAENVPLQTEATKAVSEYDKLAGAMIVEFRGEQYTLQQLARFLEEPDREMRQEAWTASAERRLQDRDAIEAIFSRLFDIRSRIAHNADKANYRDYIWQSYGRFDYTPDDCHAFADAVEQVVVPVVRELDEQRRNALGVEALRPWDLSVDVKGRAPLRPFAADRPETLVEGVRATLNALNPPLADEFAELEMGAIWILSRGEASGAGGFSPRWKPVASRSFS